MRRILLSVTCEALADPILAFRRLPIAIGVRRAAGVFWNYTAYRQTWIAGGTG
jgi:hypothetical protein